MMCHRSSRNFTWVFYREELCIFKEKEVLFVWILTCLLKLMFILFVYFDSDNLLRRAACQEAQVMSFNALKLKPALSPLRRKLGLFQGTGTVPCIGAVWIFPLPSGDESG